MFLGTLILSITYGRDAKAHGRPIIAYVAGTLSISDKASLALTGGSGNTLIEEGAATGTLPGKAKVSLTIATTTATSKFTLYPRGGSISGSGTVRLHTGGSVAYASFSGSLRVGHGTGRYAHVSGAGNMYGVLNRENSSTKVEVIGILHN